VEGLTLQLIPVEEVAEEEEVVVGILESS